VPLKKFGFNKMIIRRNINRIKSYDAKAQLRYSEEQYNFVLNDAVKAAAAVQERIFAGAEARKVRHLHFI